MPETMEKDKNVEELNQLQQRLIILHNKINSLNTPRNNFSSILEDESLLAVYHKEFGKIAKPLAYVITLRMQFSKWHQSNPQLAMEEVRKRLQVLVNLINLFSPGDVIRLRKVVLALSRIEIDEIHKCVGDVNRWTAYALGNVRREGRIDFFFQRLVVYLGGGILDGVQFLGLFSHFRDSQLAKELLTNPAIKNLRTFKKQMEFFRKAMYITLEALRKGGRQDLFYGTQEKDFKDGFYYNLRAGRKWIKVVKERFGNEEFAQLLESFDERMHEYPEKWEKEFQALSVRLNDPTYQNEHIIYPAMQALLALFQRAINRISKSEVGFKEINEMLGKLEKEIERRKKRLLREDIARLRKEFDEIDNKVADEMAIVVPLLISYMQTSGALLERREISLIKTLKGQSKYAIDIQKAMANAKTHGIAFYDSVQQDRFTIMKSQLADSSFVDAKIKSYVEILETRINSMLIVRLREVVDFIRQHDGEFTIPISATVNLLPEFEGSFSKIQDELITELKKEGIDFTRPLYG